VASIVSGGGIFFPAMAGFFSADRRKLFPRPAETFPPVDFFSAGRRKLFPAAEAIFPADGGIFPDGGFFFRRIFLPFPIGKSGTAERKIEKPPMIKGEAARFSAPQYNSIR